MKITRTGGVATIALVGALALSSCTAANEVGAGTDTDLGAASGLTGTLVGSGASSQGSAQEAWTAAFQSANPDVTVEYDPAGSGSGRDTFLAGGAAFAGSDRAFKLDEIESGTFGACVAESGIVEIPAYISPIAVIFNLDGVESLNLDGATLARIFLGEITVWNDPAIAEQNPDVALPATAITAVHRADDSGTTENFTEYLAAAAPEVWTHEPDGVWPLQSGEAASQTSGMIDTVTRGVGTIGYADASRAGGLGTVAVKVGDDYVPFSTSAAAAVVDASPLEEGRGEFDLAITLDRGTDASGVYPIVLVSYLIGCVEYADPAQGELAKAYFSYVISSEGQAVAAEAAGSAPISGQLFQKASAAVKAMR